MKKNIISFCTLSLMASALLFNACADKQSDKPADSKAKTSANAGPLPNYRYIDSDSIMANYNLSKDFQEQMVRLQSDLESEASRQESQIRSLQSAMQTKMQNNTYTEDTYKADQNRLAQANQAAEQALGKKQSAMEQTLMNNQKILTDSIQNFIEEYNKTRHYDAIFYKGAAVYIDPRLDITDEVIEGLNARYNKVKK
ncbi:MAG: OmpH family outer membrane protein [Muribaculum sp.]|nr:OmpH family outer membrane protein [Muribaculum sp.]